MGALRPGQRLEGTSYQVVREIGAGGMGVVYEIEHVRLKKRYVAKVIHDQIRNEDGAARRMEREAQVLAAINHPNIVQVHDVGATSDGVSYFVMEKLEGVDLRSTMRLGLTRIRAIEIITDVLDALDYVHRQGIVHRDIKPENVFLSEQPTGTVTKVLDFGIVHIFDRDGRVSQSRITKTGGFVGTLYYAAPEQMQGKAAGPPNDVYAAGLVLFEMLAGRGPFDDDPGVGLSRCFKPAPLLSELVPNAPPALTDAVAKALEQEPARRPSAGALANELRAAAAALRSAPGAAEDEAIRAEVHDLLRHMAPPAEIPAPRPAAGRLPTPPESAALAPSGAAPTAAPPTPVMAGAPGRDRSDLRAAFEPTLASATGDGAIPAPATPAAGQPPPAAGAAIASPTMPGVGLAPTGGPTSALGHASAAPVVAGTMPGAGSPMQTGPSPIANGHRASSPGPVTPPNAHVAQPQTAPPAPHGPSSPERPGAAPRMSQPGVPQLFASTMPVHPVQRSESTPNPPARQGDTSPGLYATVDNQPVSTPLPKRTPWAAIAIAGGAAVLLLVLVGGAFALRHKAPKTSTASAPTPSSASSASSADEATVTASSDPHSVTPPTVISAATASADAVPSARSTSAVPPGATSIPAVALTTASARPSGATPAGQPPSRSPPTSAPATKPPAPASPARTGNSTHGVEKDGYVKSL